MSDYFVILLPFLFIATLTGLIRLLMLKPDGAKILNQIRWQSMLLSLYQALITVYMIVLFASLLFDFFEGNYTVFFWILLVSLLALVVTVLYQGIWVKPSFFIIALMGFKQDEVLCRVQQLFTDREIPNRQSPYETITSSGKVIIYQHENKERRLAFSLGETQCVLLHFVTLQECKWFSNEFLSEILSLDCAIDRKALQQYRAWNGILLGLYLIVMPILVYLISK